jgi:hypothetical protein
MMEHLRVGEIIKGLFTRDEFHIKVIKFAQKFGFDPGTNFYIFATPSNKDHEYYRSEKLRILAREAVEWLNENVLRPEFTYFRIRGNSLYLLPNIEEARESVRFVSTQDAEEPSNDYFGLWLHINTFGYTTLFFRDERGFDYELWGVL